MIALKAPFPYFGGKSRVASIIWEALGQPEHYIEPFFGSGAVLLARPNYDPLRHTETVNDKDGYICNVWRAIKYHPDETAKWADWPVNHADLMARRRVLLANNDYLLENLIKDDVWCDPKLAGYWIWAASCWVGSGLTRPNAIPHLSSKGKGVNITGQIPHLSSKGQGINITGQIPHLSSKGKGVNITGQIPGLSYERGEVIGRNENIYKWFSLLSERLRRVRVVCGDWTRVCGGDWQDNCWRSVGIFFDPPYGVKTRKKVYDEDSFTIADEVRAWAIERGKRDNYRIVIAGYDEHEELSSHGWTSLTWIAQGGYANQSKSWSQGKENRKKEKLWFSPGCRKTCEMSLLEGLDGLGGAGSQL